MGAEPPILADGQQCPLAHQHRTDQLRARRSHLGGKRAFRLPPLLAGYWKALWYAFKAGAPPRCTYSTLEPFGISPASAMAISPAIDFPS